MTDLTITSNRPSAGTFVGLSNSASTELNFLGANLSSSGTNVANVGYFMPESMISVKDYGAVGNGTTDDTTAIQNALNDLAAGVVSSGGPKIDALFFPAGNYVISATLKIPPMAYKRIFGVSGGGKNYSGGIDGSVILQTGNNIPVLEAIACPSYTSLFNTIEDLQLTYANFQGAGVSPAADYTNSFCLLFQGLSAPGSTTPANGAFLNWTIRRCRFFNGYIGMGNAWSSPPGPVPSGGYSPTQPAYNPSPNFINMFFFNCEDLFFQSIQQTAIYIVPRLGNPVSVWTNTQIQNTNASPAIQSTGQAIFTSQSELLFNGMDIEGWYDEACSHGGGAPVTYRTLHIEHHTFTAATKDLITNFDGPLTVTDADLSGVLGSVSGTTITGLNLFTNNVQSVLNAQNIRLTITAQTPANGAGSWNFFKASSHVIPNGSTNTFYPKKSHFRNIMDISTAQNGVIPCAATDTDSLGAIASYDDKFIMLKSSSTSTPPTPSVYTGSHGTSPVILGSPLPATDMRGSFTFGCSASTPAGSPLITITYLNPHGYFTDGNSLLPTTNYPVNTNPIVLLTPQNQLTESCQPYVYSSDASGFTIAFGNATVAQAAPAFSLGYLVVG